MGKTPIIRNDIIINSIKSVFINIMVEDINLASAMGFIVNKDKHFYLIINRHVVTGKVNQTNKCLDKNTTFLII